jgi:hypothetical protein
LGWLSRPALASIIDWKTTAARYPEQEKRARQVLAKIVAGSAFFSRRAARSHFAKGIQPW